MLNPKRFIREKIAKHKKSLSRETVDSLSQKIGNRLIQIELFQQAKCIALYCAIENEVQTSELINEWHTEKKIALPVVSGENLHFYAFSEKENPAKDSFGIPEPVTDELIPPDRIDLFIVPGIAFDYDCNRMGRGKGYYDRYLSGIDKPVIGLCFDFQLFEHIPCEAHDKKMTVVITENITVSQHHQ